MELVNTYLVQYSLERPRQRLMIYFWNSQKNKMTIGILPLHLSIAAVVHYNHHAEKSLECPLLHLWTSDHSTHNKALWSSEFSAVAQSCLILCDPMDCSTPGLPVRHQLLEFTRTHVHWVGDAIRPSYPLSSPSPPAFNLSQHQGIYIKS